MKEGFFIMQGKNISFGKIFEKAISHASSKKKRSPPPPLAERKRRQRRQRRERKVLSIIDPENEREN